MGISDMDTSDTQELAKLRALRSAISSEVDLLQSYTDGMRAIAVMRPAVLRILAAFKAAG